MHPYQNRERALYKIIGTDQKEYGPVTADQINQWIAQGRVNGLTKAQADGGEWKTLNQFPEFSATFGYRAASSSASPPILSAPSSQPVKTSGLAIASLVLGFLGFCGITAIIGLILGIIAIHQINKSDGMVSGRGIALIGTLVSAVFLLMILLGANMFGPTFAKAKSRAAELKCVNNARQLAMTALIYTGSHTGQLPAASNWCDSLTPFVASTNVFQCPATTNESCSYAFNTNLSGMNIGKINPNTVLFFESDAGWNASGGRELMIQQPRHSRYFVVVFADGHTRIINAAILSDLRWNP